MKSIFISSTFRDMQAERDILHQQVFPALRKRLADFGEDVQELDLRWGVDTSRMSEEQSGEFVIESCIDSIDRCKPYIWKRSARSSIAGWRAKRELPLPSGAWS